MHFNQLSPAEAERLAMLAEEAGEIVQIVGKILRHGYASKHPDNLKGPNNRAMLQRELTDLHAVLGMMVRENDLPHWPNGSDIIAADARKQRFTHHQET